jgi:hypothetical protein
MLIARSLEASRLELVLVGAQRTSRVAQTKNVIAVLDTNKFLATINILTGMEERAPVIKRGSSEGGRSGTQELRFVEA